MELFRFENVTYSIDNNEVLKNISWEINENENWIVLGPNGSGKTTLLKMIYGFIRPNTSGRLLWLEKPLINLLELRKSIGLISSYVTQRIFEYDTVYETIISGKYAMYGYWNYYTPSNEVIDQAEKLIEQFGYKKFIDRKFSSLSQGEQQIVLLIRTLMAEPYLIIIDEPCSGLDPKSRQNFLSVLQEIMSNSNKVSFIFVTHHIEEILPEFNNTVFIRNGQLIKRDRTEILINSENLTDLYEIKCRVLKNSDRYSLRLI